MNYFIKKLYLCALTIYKIKDIWAKIGFAV